MCLSSKYTRIVVQMFILLCFKYLKILNYDIILYAQIYVTFHCKKVNIKTEGSYQ